MNKLKKKLATKTMNYTAKLILKWHNEWLNRIGYFEPIISLKKLFGD